MQTIKGYKTHVRKLDHRIKLINDSEKIHNLELEKEYFLDLIINCKQVYIK